MRSTSSSETVHSGGRPQFRRRQNDGTSSRGHATASPTVRRRNVQPVCPKMPPEHADTGAWAGPGATKKRRRSPPEQVPASQDAEMVAFFSNHRTPRKVVCPGHVTPCSANTRVKSHVLVGTVGATPLPSLRRTLGSHSQKSHEEPLPSRQRLLCDLWDPRSDGGSPSQRDTGTELSLSSFCGPTDMGPVAGRPRRGWA